jgi:hypothetical protein
MKTTSMLRRLRDEDLYAKKASKAKTASPRRLGEENLCGGEGLEDEDLCNEKARRLKKPFVPRRP